MTRLRTMLYGAVALLASMALTTPANSDSSNFAGPYLAVQGSMIGVEMDGEFHDVTQNHQGSVGMVSAMTGLQAGYNFPIGDAGFLTIGATLSDGDATFDAKELANAKSVKLSVSDFTEYFIEPSVNITENSAIYIKGGMITGDLNVTGDDVTNTELGLDGWVAGIGTKTVTDAGLFIKTEAGAIVFDEIIIRNITDESQGTTGFANADPTVAYGSITIGFLF